jgi:alkanesulfonate monooxygenase SsuD/methylene tetrahydromethanopterin reductase-like flavin-dependent oxidoreductase (luciferase family)
VRFGLELPLAALSADEAMSLAIRAEEAGLGSIWLSEEDARDAISLIAAISRETTSLTLATGQLSMYTRTPYLIAMTSVTLAELSGGRFVLGLSPTHSTSIRDSHGLPVTPLGKGGDHLREIVVVIRALLRGERVSFKGEYIEVPEARLRVLPTSPVPIYLNARVLSLLETAGELTDGVRISIATPEWIRDVAIHHVEIGATRGKRSIDDIDIAYHPVICLSDDEEAAVAATSHVVGPYLRNAEVMKVLVASGLGAEVNAMQSARDKGIEMPTPEALVRAITLVGNVQTIGARIREYIEAGVRHLILRPQPIADQPMVDAATNAIAALVGSFSNRKPS